MTTTLRRLTMLAAGLAAFAPAGAALAQDSASNSATATVTVGNALTIDPTANLNFGRIAISDAANAATVTVGSAGSVTSISNATEVSGGTINAAAFTVSGQGGATYAVSFPQSSINLGAGATPPTVDSFTSNPAAGAGQLSAGTIGTQTLNVGGTLHVPANTTAGNYSGTFQVSVAYN